MQFCGFENAGVPRLGHVVGQVELLGDRGGEPAKEQVGVRLRLLVHQLKIDQGDPLADVERRLDRSHQERALAHLPRTLDRQRLSGLTHDGQRGRVGGPRQIPGIVDVERPARHGQRRGVRRRQAGVATRVGGAVGVAGRRRATSSRRAVPPAAAACRPVASRRRTGCCPDRRIKGYGSGPSNLTRTGRMLRTRSRRGMMTGHLDLAADHLAAARFRGEEDDQEFGLANLRSRSRAPTPGRRSAAIDEDPWPAPSRPATISFASVWSG